MKKSFPLALLVLVMVAGLVSAQTAPRFVAEVSTTGFLPCYKTAATDQQLTLLEVRAVTDLTLSCWSWNATDGWVKISPQWAATTGAAAGSDTVLTILEGETRTYRFAAPRALSALYVGGGTGYLQGE